MKWRHQNDTDTNTDTDTDTDTDTEDSNSIKVNVAKELGVKRKRNDKKEKKFSGNVENLEGRHCELCGGGSDGKPPPLISSKDMPPDELDGFSREDGWLGRLISPIVDHHGIPRTWVHYQCILWSPEVHLTESRSWKNVEAALTRGKSLKCSHCRKRGATLGCRIKKCPRTYHLACARFKGCKFDHKEFLMACPKHLHMFQQPHSDDLNSNKTKLGSDKNREFESNDDDDGQINKDGKFGNIVPTFVGGTHGEKDGDKYFGMGGWESVGGLQQVIDCMKEVVMIPLLYPEFFDRYAITPPRGVLLHGYPGTGKTHVVRALVGSCARGHKRIAYFSCKGADCLGKYVGDSEKHLKQLFQAAEECQPSIIFFDEIDGLVPSRNNKQQDQTHTSVVSTLLALLDGIKSRGSVVVIGATNRPNAIDSALRRPGRFDREIYFPLPSLEDRISILSLYTQNWPKAVLKPNLLEWIGRKTPGFAGADLQALCIQTVMIALKRSFPLKEALSKVDPHYDHHHRPDLPVDVVVVEERDWLKALSTCPPPCSRRDQLLVVANDVGSSLLPSHLISCLIRPLSTLLVLLHMEETICLPNSLRKDATVIESVMVSALKRKKVMENNKKWWFHVEDLLKDDEIGNEIKTKWQEAAGEGIEDSSFADENNAKQRTSFILENSPGFCILIAGNPSCGQRHLASYILNSYSEHVQRRKLDLITLVSQGYTSLEQGVAITLADFVSRGSCLIFMPRIDLWAIEPQDLHPSEEEQCNSIQRPSYAWKIFTQQVELLCLSTPFVFLATSDVPFSLLPQDIRKFFGNELADCKLLERKKYRMPRFSIQVDDRFNHELVVDQSAEKVSKDLAELFVVLIHQKYHDKDDREEQRKRHRLEERKKKLVSEAISAFGSEILQNPQFSPLCVVTSKFKLEESGPCASISKSEWKDLKFKDACVVHSSMEDTDDELENHGRVKGLLALGLLASRGVYTTIQQVCSDVRAIRGLILEKVNAKVEDAGKDRLRYLGVLSQAAWLQDVVDSWAYYYKQKSLKLQVDDCVRTDIPSIICSINCCSGCVKILHVVTRNILKQKIKSLKAFDGSTESIHEVVMRTWGKLARKVTKSFVEGVKKSRRKDVGDEKDEEENYKKLVESYGMESCGCRIMRNSDGTVISSECSLCHSTSRGGKYYKFVFKNNILVQEEEDDEASFYCKYNTLCLASIIQPIAKKKKNKNKKSIHNNFKPF